MKIIHLEASCGWGGQEIRILKEALGMRAKGHEVVLVVEPGGKLVERARSQNFLCYEVSFHKKWWLFSFFQLIKIFRSHGIDIVNTHSSLDSWLGGMAARWVKIPIVRTRHLSTPVQKGMNSRILYKGLADFVVGTCSEILPMIASQAGLSSKQYKMVATGVDPEWIEKQLAIAPLFRESQGISKKTFLVGTACFMRSWKGIEEFLQAAALLKDSSHIRWVIIGGGHEEIYRKIARSLELDKTVLFTGHLENPFPAIQALDVFCLLSTANEGISQAILQAAYLKKPLIATPTGGLKEICLQEKTGIVVPPFSALHVKDAVLFLQSNPHLCQKYGERARALVELRFTLAHTIDEMEQIYRGVKL